MPNMSYCRFYNTRADLLDVQEHFMAVLDKGSDEARAREEILRICKELAEYSVDELPLRDPGDPEAEDDDG